MKDDDLISKEDLIQNLGVDDYMEDYSQYPNFGIFNLTIYQAARLVVIDLWFSGSDFQDVEEPTGFDGRITNELIESLASPIAVFEGLLIASIEKGQLKTIQIRRDFDDTIETSLTFLEYETLINWLEERGYDTGDHANEWLDKEVDIANRIAKEVAFLRAKDEADIESKHSYDIGSLTSRQNLLPDVESMKAAIKDLVLENKNLRENISDLKSKTAPHSEPNPPIRKSAITKANNSSLNIIGGLLQLLLNVTDQEGTKRSTYRSQAEIIADLEDKFPMVQGLKKSNLENKFAEAKNSIKQ